MVENIIQNFLYKLNDDDLLIELIFDYEYDDKYNEEKLYFNNTLYSIDENYKIKNIEIGDNLNGYYFNGNIYGKTINTKNLNYDEKLNLIESTKKDSKLYGLPICKTNKNKKINKCLFLDRDGIIIKDAGYIGTTDRIIFNDCFFDIVKYANKKDILVIIITNQAGVAYGYYTERDVIKIHNYIDEEFKKHNAIINDFYYCPYHTKGNNKKYIKETLLRKPNPAMILKASTKYNIDIERSIMIGDRDSDIINLPYLKSYLIETEVYKIENTALTIKPTYIKKLIDSL